MLLLDRILAIPDSDRDFVQMGISGQIHAALVERGGVRKDGIKAKASVLKKSFVKGDKKLTENTSLTPNQARKIKGAIAGVSGGKVVKGKSPRDRQSSPIFDTVRKTLNGGDNFLVKKKDAGLTKIANAIANNKGFIKADGLGDIQVLKVNKPSNKFPYGSASVVVDYGDKFGKERRTIELVQLSDRVKGATKKESSTSALDRLDQLVKLGNESKPTTKAPSATAKKLNLTAAKEAEILKKIKRF